MKRMSVISIALASALVASFATFAYGAPAFHDDLDSFDTTLWHAADGWGNGRPFGAYWDDLQVTFANGEMSITCEPGSYRKYKYVSGEYRTNEFYHYGLYEVRMKPDKGSGFMSGSLFTYTGPTDGNPWDEIDIEFLGKDTEILSLNYFTDGVGGHEYEYHLGFDASLEYHTYAFEWLPDSITWFVDGVAIHTATQDIPSNPSRIMTNVWVHDGSVSSWLGPIDSTAVPVTASYDWIRFTPAGEVDTTAPEAPTSLTANSVSGSQIDLSWGSSGEPDFDHYNIYREGVKVAESTESSFSDTGLSASTAYTYTVTAVDTADNESPDSNEASATTQEGSGDTTPPAAPVELAASVLSDSEIVLTWDANQEPDTAKYGVYRSTVEGGGYQFVGETQDLVFVDTGLAGSTTYYYVITATDTSGNESLYSEEASTTTDATGMDATPPSTPVGLSASARGPGKASLNWEDNTEPDMNHYNVYRSETSGSGYLLIGTAPGTIGDSWYQDSTGSSGVTYYWVVAAVDTSGNESPYSNESSATVK